jgi:hypothetical protein
MRRAALIALLLPSGAHDDSSTCAIDASPRGALLRFERAFRAPAGDLAWTIPTADGAVCDASIEIDGAAMERQVMSLEQISREWWREGEPTTPLAKLAGREFHLKRVRAGARVTLRATVAVPFTRDGVLRIAPSADGPREIEVRADDVPLQFTPAPACIARANASRYSATVPVGKGFSMAWTLPRPARLEAFQARTPLGIFARLAFLPERDLPLFDALDVHVAVDGSGSMAGRRYEHALEAAAIALAPLRPCDRLKVSAGRATLDVGRATPLARRLAMAALLRAVPAGTEAGRPGSLWFSDQAGLDDDRDPRRGLGRLLMARYRPPASAVDLAGGRLAQPIRPDALWCDPQRVWVRWPRGATPTVHRVEPTFADDPAVATFWYAEANSDELAFESGVLGANTGYLFWTAPKSGEADGSRFGGRFGGRRMRVARSACGAPRDPVLEGLHWLEARQREDGAIPSDGARWAGREITDVGVTALYVLASLQAPRHWKWGEAAAIAYLARRTDRNGRVRAYGDPAGRDHDLAALALAAAAKHDSRHAPAAERAKSARRRGSPAPVILEFDPADLTRLWHPALELLPVDDARIDPLLVELRDRDGSWRPPHRTKNQRVVQTIAAILLNLR